MPAPETVSLALTTTTWVDAADFATSAAAAILIVPAAGEIEVHVAGTSPPAANAPGVPVRREGFSMATRAGTGVWVRTVSGTASAVVIRQA